MKNPDIQQANLLYDIKLYVTSRSSSKFNVNQ